MLTDHYRYHREIATLSAALRASGNSPASTAAERVPTRLLGAAIDNTRSTNCKAVTQPSLSRWLHRQVPNFGRVIGQQILHGQAVRTYELLSMCR